jgi:MFS family permease
MIIKNRDLICNKLNFEQKQAIFILSIGTFLEYFDLMLYIHMAIILNELFFPKTDPFTSSIFAAFAFCSTYAFRPIGALIFGYIGDKFGRKTSLLLSTNFMSFSCIIMANLPTYNDIGILATWIITICRILQEISSMGEVIIAQIYLTETIKPPMQYFAVSSIAVVCRAGTTASLIIANICIINGVNWRIAFWAGALIAIVSVVARNNLRESPIFLESKNNKSRISEQTRYKTLLANFALMSCWPIWFYITYIYSSNILKDIFFYSANDIINHNLIISIISLTCSAIISYLSFIIHPLKILKILFFIFILLIILSLYLFPNINYIYQLFLFQLIIIIFGPNSFPAEAVLHQHISILKRVTYSSFIYALSRTIIYIITSFGLIYITKYYGHLGLLYIIIPTLFTHYFARKHFDDLEKLTNIT